MKDLNKKIAVLVYGPPGSGKGTQANLLVNEFGLFHLDSGDTLRKTIYDPKFKKNKIVQREKKLNEVGLLQTPSFVLNVISKKIMEAVRLGQGIVLSGSPRTLYEAFGDKKTRGEMHILDKRYGRKNIFIFFLDIPEAESFRRNSRRVTCSVCKMILLGSGIGNRVGLKNCPFCGGKIIHRIDDNPEIIKIRLREYRERTQPIFDELKKHSYVIYKIDGRPAPYKIHKRIVSYIK